MPDEIQLQKSSHSVEGSFGWTPRSLKTPKGEGYQAENQGWHVRISPELLRDWLPESSGSCGDKLARKNTRMLQPEVGKSNNKNIRTNKQNDKTYDTKDQSTKRETKKQRQYKRVHIIQRTRTAWRAQTAKRALIASNITKA